MRVRDEAGNPAVRRPQDRQGVALKILGADALPKLRERPEGAGGLVAKHYGGMGEAIGGMAWTVGFSLNLPCYPRDLCDDLVVYVSDHFTHKLSELRQPKSGWHGIGLDLAGRERSGYMNPSGHIAANLPAGTRQEEATASITSRKYLFLSQFRVVQE